MAVTEEFRLDVLEVLDEYTASLENQTGNNSVPIMAEDEIDETVSMPALKYSANPLENSRAVPEGYRQVPFVTFWNRIDKLATKVEVSTADLDVLHTATAAARDAANEAAQAANQSREAIERNEQTRIINEQTRQENEATRQGNESQRVTNENTRKDNETQRQSNENTRKSNETQRVSDENTRKSNETIRQNQESTRQNQESTRQNQETTRQNQESTRQNQEQTRQNQEQTRQTNENNRQQAESLRQSTFETNEQQRQQDFEDAEAERIAAMLMTECYVDFDTMCLMFVQPEKDTTDYNVVDGDLMITVQYEEE